MGATSRILLMLLSTAPFTIPRPSASLRCLARRSRPSLPTFRYLHRTPRRHRHLPLRATDHGVRALSATPELHAELGERRAWPEWSSFVHHVTAAGYGDRGAGGVDDVFEDWIEVPESFARCARACLSFAYDRPSLLRLLSKEDIRVVVDNVSPSLFKNCSDSVQRMDLFLNAEGSTVLNHGNVQTVDLVLYLLSYAHNYMFCSRPHDINNSESVDVSVRNLLKEMVNLSGPFQSPDSIDSINRQSPSILEQSSESPISNIQMKRGDWRCPKCNLMNFARNTYCLECREARPKRQLTGGEWECPQCDFFNYGRNMACLRCDCKRPDTSFSHTAAEDTGFGNMRSGAKQGLSGHDSINKIDRILGKISENSSCDSSSNQGAIRRRGEISPQERQSNYVPFVPLPPDMFRTPGGTNTEEPSGSSSLNSQSDPMGVLFSENSKLVGESPVDHKSSDPDNRTAELHDAGKSGNPISGDNFPDIMPMRKGENRFVVSKKKDRSLTSPQYKRRLAREKADSSSFVPFVPFPPGYFARKDNQPEAGSAAPKAELANADAACSVSTQNVVERSDDSSSPAQMSTERGSNWQGGNIESSRRNLYGDEVDPSRMSGDSTSTSYHYNNFHKNEVESWDSRPSQAVVDDNFPDNMPMRKGENRFVVSKKKDRFLTSPQYKRRLAMEKADSSSFAPFVPFPSGYFARKDNQPETGSVAPKDELANADAAFSVSTQNDVERSDDSSSAQMSTEKGSNWQGGNIESSRRNLYGDEVNPSRMSGDGTSTSDHYNNFNKNEVESWDSRSSQGVVDDSWDSSQQSFDIRNKSWSNDGGLSSYGNNQRGSHSRVDVARSDSPNPSSWSNKVDGQNDMYPTLGNNTNTNNAGRNIPQAEASEGSKESSSWKSLEGSAVSEPDPLDMSEEAKAQRWFRRVAQITDISELANIPDEDFPQIMPMRKGVNRFVVSKRKKPSERRLTSPQYRQNLPIVRSEPENDSSNQGKV